ncbi:DUF3060 domain-containing protein [Myxococcus stipitatus]|uniref:DUF3060 domain-containing protein n=1 Tax=Myxococcus stipitatus TaxID=83455 RepID=UPI001F221E10|nr:DUF3060 domain-containing protein [Myxococcus stipitatus]MCE9672492.1 DUF3060 domain-containing protein [Myxococcus stipitatus]
MSVTPFRRVAAVDDEDATSVKVGKDGSVKVKAQGHTVETRGGTARVRTGDGVDVQVDGAMAHDDDEEKTSSRSGDSLELVDSDRTVTLDCGDGGKAEIVGSSNKVTLTGVCAHVEVTGSDNKVVVNAARRIETTGSGNSVTWKQGAEKGKKPRVSNTGTNNRIAQAR